MYELLSHSHYLGIVLVLVLSGFGLPIPEEVPVVMAGILAAHGTLDPGLAFAACGDSRPPRTPWRTSGPTSRSGR